MRPNPSLRSRALEWLLWRLPLKRRFINTVGLRERVLKSRPSNPRPPRSFFRRYLVSETSQEGHRIFTISPRGRAAKLNILYLHGGAYVYEIAAPQWGLIGQLLQRMEIAVTVPLYPLAPEHTCVEVLAFAHRVYDTLRAKPGQPLALLGDSAGGGMALALSQQLRDANNPQPEALVLVSPWLDVTCSDPRQPLLDKLDPLLASQGLKEEGLWYAGDLSPTDPRVSPIFGSVAELPPMHVLTGTHDLLNADACRLAEKLVDPPSTRISEYKNMLHVWPAMPIPEARIALAEIVTFLQGVVSRTHAS